MTDLARIPAVERSSRISSALAAIGVVSGEVRNAGAGVAKVVFDTPAALGRAMTAELAHGTLRAAGFDVLFMQVTDETASFDLKDERAA